MRDTCAQLQAREDSVAYRVRKATVAEQCAAQQARIQERDAESRADLSGQRAERLERQVAALRVSLEQALDRHRAEVKRHAAEVR